MTVPDGVVAGVQVVDVSLCILNRNQKDLLRQCLESCYQEVERSALSGEVIVIDNGSEDGSPEMVAKDFPQALLIRNAENAGFSVANNQGIARSSGRYVFILNNDTLLLPGCVEELVRFMDAHPEVGLAGPKLLNRDGSVQLGYHRRLPRLADTLVTLFWLHHVWRRNPITRRALLVEQLADQASDHPWPIEQVGGCAMMIRRETLESLGAFDEDFYWWYEDVDLCERISKSSWKTTCVPRARMIHLGGTAFASSEIGEKLAWQVRGLVRFYQKNRGGLEYRMVSLLALVSLALRTFAATALALSPRAATRSRWRSAPAACLRTMKSILAVSLFSWFGGRMICLASPLRHRCAEWIDNVMRQQAIALLRKLGLFPVADEIRFWFNVARNYAKNRTFATSHATESFPPARISYDAYSFVDYENYDATGRRSAEVVVHLIAGRIKPTGARVLEWGCGPGRIVRHLAKLCQNSGIELFATDYNRESIEWCSSAIPGVTFAINGLHPPLPFSGAFFDAVYSSSVFTHLSEEMHYAWLRENFRVLKHKGLMIFSTSGDRLKDKLLPSELRQYEAGELVVRAATKEGKRSYSAFQSPAFIKQKFLPSVPGFELIRHEEELPLAAIQDVWVVRKF